MKKKLREFAKAMGLGLGYGMKKGGLVGQMQKHIDASAAGAFQTIPMPKDMGKGTLTVEDLIRARDMLRGEEYPDAGSARKFRLRGGIEIQIYKSKNLYTDATGPYYYATWTKDGIRQPGGSIDDDDLSRIFGKLRLAIAKGTNPQVREVHDRMTAAQSYEWGRDGLSNVRTPVPRSSPVTVLGGLKFKKVILDDVP